LNILKDENGKKIKFSVELMQREEFCKILLNDELISSLLTQIKDIFSRSKNQEVTKWLLELDENYEHKNEMTRFIEYINDKLSIKKNNENKNDNSNYLEELKNKEEINEQNEKIYEKEVEEINKKIKKKRNKKIENNNKTNNQEEKMNELQFKDIDEILNYINDETDSKKGKKKCKKAKKNKNKKINKEEEKEKENEINKEKNNYCENEDLLNFEKEFQNFKEELTKDTMYVYEINNKIKPCLSENFLNQISII
jgi:hypothetical protein